MSEDALAESLIWYEKFNALLVDLRLLSDRAKALGLPSTAETLREIRFQLAVSKGAAP